MNEFYPEGYILATQNNINALKSLTTLNEAKDNYQILEARATLCDSSHNLIVDLGCMRGIIPRNEGALGIREGKVRDIAVISRVNRPVCFIVTGFDKDDDGNDVAILSRRKAQEICLNNYLNNLLLGDVINARITHLENFGAFADIGCGIVSLIPIDSISVSRIDHPKERFTVDMDIKAIIKSRDNGRICLSHKELLGTWQENADMFSTGETVAGIIRSVEDYGAFVELTPNLAGLAELKTGILPKQQASVYIKSIIPEKMKVKLVIINTFDYDYKVSSPRYFFEGNHLDDFIYSPPDSSKIIETVFSNNATSLV